MTYHVNFSEVATSFSLLASEIGITVTDLDNIPANGQILTPVLVPRPVEFISNMSFVASTYGTAGAEKIDIDYDMAYLLLYSPIGTNLNFTGYQAMIETIASIAEVALLHDTLAGCIDFRLSNAPSIGPTLDPAGNLYHGCEFIFHVKQLAEVA